MSFLIAPLMQAPSRPNSNSASQTWQENLSASWSGPPLKRPKCVPAIRSRLKTPDILNGPPCADVVDTAVGLTDEQIALGRQEIYVTYPAGMGRSKLKLPAARTGTARNMTTVAKLAEISASG
jgi:hypothetical protein